MPPISINFNLPFNEAIAQMAARGVVLPDIYYGQLQGIHKQLSFSIANVAKLDQLQGALDSLTEHLKNGGTFASWQKHVDVQSLGLPKHRLDNIFRTNIQQAYNHGHWQQALANKSTHGYLMYDAINDSRTRPSHKANDGIIRKIEDPIWKRIWFSRNVYRCRCRLISLTEKQAFDRSNDGKGMYKTATEDPLRDKAWDSVDVMNADFLSFGVEQAVSKRLLDSAINPVLKTAMQNHVARANDSKIIQADSSKTVQDYLKLYEFKDIERKLKNKELAQFLKITPEEHSMIHTYTASGFVDINRLLNGLEPYKENAQAVLKAAAEVLSSGLSKIPNYKGLIIRRVDLSSDVLAKYKKGEVITHDAFTSATRGEKDVFDGNVRMKIWSKTGKRIDYFSTKDDEFEVLFDKGTRFKVKDLEEKPLNKYEKIVEITLEEV